MNWRSLLLVKLALLGGVYLLVLYMLGEITSKDLRLTSISRAEHSA